METRRRLGLRGAVWWAVGCFLASRMIILFGYDMYISDVALYHQVATSGMVEGQTAYRDFFFPYPPLALAPVYLPILFAQELATYREVFQVQLFAVECVLVLFMTRFMRAALGMSPGQTAGALLCYSALGLLVGHLLYDRLDVFIALFFVLAVSQYRAQPMSRWRDHGLAALGGWFKLLPLFWMPLRWMQDVLSPTGIDPRGALRLAAFAGVFAGALWIYDMAVGGGLFEYLGQHGERGIQIESVWATPLMSWQLVFPSADYSVVTNYGAQHLADSAVPGAYLFLARYAGFLALGAAFAVLAAVVYSRKKADPDFALSAEQFYMGALAVVVFLLASQRVLSPQYFIWLLPGISILVVRLRSLWFGALVLLVYVLTHVGFDVGYWRFAQGDPVFVRVVILRNLCLLGLTGWVVGVCIKRAGTIEARPAIAVASRVDHQKTGRNAPCPCGSGKKYKHCCFRTA